MTIERACVMAVRNNTQFITQKVFRLSSNTGVEIKISEVVMNKESSKYGINRNIGADENRIKILFICRGRILKSPGKACKINGFTKRKGAYYTTTTPFLKAP